MKRRVASPPTIDKRAGYNRNTISFVYTTVQYDITVKKTDGGASVKKVSPPTVQRPKN